VQEHILCSKYSKVPLSRSLDIKTGPLLQPPGFGHK